MPESIIVVNKQTVLDWVEAQMRSLESSHDESLDYRVQRYHDAISLYESGDDTKLVELLEEDREDAERRLDMPGDAMAAEFGREAVEITKEGIQGEIDEIDSLLGFLRG